MIYQRTCAHCELEFEPTRPNAQYCSPAHRNAAYRARRKAEEEAAGGPASDETPDGSQDVGGIGVRRALLARLREAKTEASPMGQAMLAVAHEIDAIAQGKAGRTGDSLTALVLRLGVELPRELDRAATAAAVAGAEDEVGKARAKRDRARGAAAR